MHRIVVPIRAFALVLGLVAPVTVHAEVVSVPSADPPSSAASLPPPTVLRGSPPGSANSVAICPPGYTLSPDYGSGCVGPSSGDYTDGSPGYDYSPDWGDDFPFGGSPGFGSGAGRFHRFSGLHNFHRFAGVDNGRAFHGRAGFHGAAGFHSFGMGVGHAGGFGRR